VLFLRLFLLLVAAQRVTHILLSRRVSCDYDSLYDEVYVTGSAAVDVRADLVLPLATGKVD
jgi:hypothetical protein